MYRSIKVLGIIAVLFSSLSVSAQIINVEDKRRTFTDSIQWFEKFSLGFNLFDNGETVIALQGDANLQFGFKNKTLISITNARFVRAGEQQFVNQGFQHLRYNSNLNSWLTYEVFGQMQFNEVAFIKLRGLAGTGPRFTFIDKDKSVMHLGLSYMYEYDEEKNGEIHRDHRLNSYLSFNLDPKDFVSMSGTIYFQPLFNQFSDYRLSASLNLEFTITKNLSFGTQYNQTFDSRRPAGAPKRIFSLSNVISYTFG